MENKRIVYVDDDEALAEMVQETLQRAGYDVVTDTDTERVLWGFAQEPDSCDLVILDHLMPRMKGFELAQWLLLNRADLPVILVTGHPELISPEEAERAGIREVLLKPLTRPELFAAVDRALSSVSA
jgi:CheY-like chemotaxis protein